jgi:hypothetical protein
VSGCDDALMPRRLIIAAGAVVATAGLLAGIASLAVPWVNYQVRGSAVNGIPVAQRGGIAVFQVPGGTLYVLAVLLLVGVVALAALGTGQTSTVALTAAPVLGALTLIVVGYLATGIGATASKVVATGIAELTVTGESAPGVYLGLVTGPLLAAGAWLVGYAKRVPTASAKGVSPGTIA